MIFFFFSSRRRHTRFDCDWSSDVCSSDLARLALQQALRREHVADLGGADAEGQRPEGAVRAGVAVAAHDGLARLREARSEEHTSELQSQSNIVCRLLLEKKKAKIRHSICG